MGQIKFDLKQLIEETGKSLGDFIREAADTLDAVYGVGFSQANPLAVRQLATSELYALAANRAEQASDVLVNEVKSELRAFFNRLNTIVEAGISATTGGSK